MMKDRLPDEDRQSREDLTSPGQAKGSPQPTTSPTLLQVNVFTNEATDTASYSPLGNPDPDQAVKEVSAPNKAATPASTAE